MAQAKRTATAAPEGGFRADGISRHGAQELDIALVEQPDDRDRQRVGRRDGRSGGGGAAAGFFNRGGSQGSDAGGGLR